MTHGAGTAFMETPQYLMCSQTHRCFTVASLGTNAIFTLDSQTTEFAVLAAITVPPLLNNIFAPMARNAPIGEQLILYCVQSGNTCQFSTQLTQLKPIDAWTVRKAGSAHEEEWASPIDARKGTFAKPLVGDGRISHVYLGTIVKKERGLPCAEMTPRPHPRGCYGKKALSIDQKNVQQEPIVEGVLGNRIKCIGRRIRFMTVALCTISRLCLQTSQSGLRDSIGHSLVLKVPTVQMQLREWKRFGVLLENGARDSPLSQ